MIQIKWQQKLFSFITNPKKDVKYATPGAASIACPDILGPDCTQTCLQ
jgi:hypothetical protein